MPTKGTTGHNIRIPDARWQAAEKKAAMTGVPIAVYVNAKIEEWINEPEGTEMNTTDTHKCNAPKCTAEFNDMRDLDKHIAEHEPYVGMPVTQTLYADRLASVVTNVYRREGKVTSLRVRRVEIDESSQWRINAEAEPHPFLAWRGILDKPVADSRAVRFAYNGYKYIGTGGASGSTLILGKSFSAADYRA